MTKTKQHLLLLFMLLIYLAIALLGFFIAYAIKNTFFATKQSAKQTQTITKVTPFPTPADWKTYTNKNYKLTFSYPSRDVIQTSSYAFGITSLAIQNLTTNTSDFQILLLPQSLAQAVGQDFDGFYAMPDNTSRIIKNPLAKDATTETFTKIRNRSINGLSALDYQSVASNAKSGSQPEIGTLIEIGNNLILIATEESNKNKREQILNSLHYPL